MSEGRADRVGKSEEATINDRRIGMQERGDRPGDGVGSTGHHKAVRARAAEGDPVALTQALVSIPSVNPSLEMGGAGEAEVAGYCAGLLADWGFEVETVGPEGRPSVLARSGTKGGRVLVLNGHLDTVGVEGALRPPFEGRLDEGRVWGRGACDMKGGVAALMAAARELAAGGSGGSGGEVVVALSADEEHASLGMAALVGRGLVADAAVVCEPTNLAIMPAHKGFCWYELTFRGRAAHGSRPELGIDAIRHAGAFLHALGAYDEELRRRDPHPLLANGSIHAGTISGGVAPSVYPERCTLTLERRTLPGEDPNAVRAEVEAVVERARTEVRDLDVRFVETLVRPATEVAADHWLVRGLADSLGRSGRPAPIEGMTAWVDAAFLNASGVPAVCFGPGSIAQAHSADEWVDASEVTLCARVLTDFGRTLFDA